MFDVRPTPDSSVSSQGRVPESLSAMSIRTDATSSVPVFSDASVPTRSWRRVSWGAVFAGMVIAVVVQLVLGLIGTAIGLSTLDPMHANGTPAASTFGIGAGVWWAVSSIVSLFAGGWVAGYLAGSPDHAEGLLHGLLAWGIATILTVYLLASAVGSVLSGGASVVGSTARAAASGVSAAAEPIADMARKQLDASGVSLDGLQREAEKLLSQTGVPGLQPTAVAGQASAAVGELTRAASGSSGAPVADLQSTVQKIVSSGSNTVDQVDRDALVNVVVARTGVTRPEAEQRVSSWVSSYEKARAAFEQKKAAAAEKAREVADAAARASSQAALAAAVALILGALAGRGRRSARERSGRRTGANRPLSTGMRAIARRVLWVAAAVVATAAVLVSVLNLSLGDKSIDRPLSHHHGITDPAFQRMAGQVLASPFVGGNTVRTLINGDEIFPSMLAALREAKTSVTFETYIFWSSSIGSEFEAAFTDAARRGVRVKVLVDWIGGELAESKVERMRAAGVEVRLYNPPRWNSLGRFNNRTHRKLMVVDGRVGFIGGVGIDDAWRGDAQDAEHWRGTHFRIEGPVVAELQSAFVDNWLKTSGEPLDTEAFFPALTPSSSTDAVKAHVFSSSPRGGSKSMQLMYLMSITAAERSIDLSAAYFVPDEVAVASLVAAARRGLRVRILLPGKPHGQADRPPRVAFAVEPLLEAGVQIHEYEPTMFHCKVMVVDGLWVSVGSSNFDPRSFSINDETNLNVYDAAFAAEQAAVFRARSVAIKVDRTRRLARSPVERARRRHDGVAGVFPALTPRRLSGPTGTEPGPSTAGPSP